MTCNLLSLHIYPEMTGLLFLVTGTKFLPAVSCRCHSSNILLPAEP